MILEARYEIKEGGVRLDAALLSAFPSTTRAFVREAIEAGEVSIISPGDARARVVTTKGLKVPAGACLQVRSLAEACDNLVAPNPAIHPRLVFEDDALLAFDKPAGQPVQPLTRSERTTLMNGVVARWPACAPLGDRPLMAGALHRIDADTSGLVLVARTASAFERLRAQFTAQTVKKTYLALVEGAVAVGGTLEGDLVHDPTLPFCRMVDPARARVSAAQRARLRPLHAVTNFKPLKGIRRGNEILTLLEVTIFTGVTHQIRAQLAAAGWPIVNDRLYGAFAVEGQVGHCLHALSAAFGHPTSGEPVEIRTAYPAWAQEESIS